MLERYDETELLDLIEGELDPRRSSALQQRLASDPQARALIDAMMRDRAALRSVGDPALPQDFLAQIEPLLARPMLIEHVPEVVPLKPGEFRRQHRRAHRRLRLGRLAAAAVLVLAALGGAWAMVDRLGVLQPAGEGHDRIANGAGQTSIDSGGASNLAGSARNPSAALGEVGVGPGVVHHARPPAELLPRQFARAEDASKEVTVNEVALAQAEVIPAEFAIVVQSRDAASAEAALTRAVSALGERGALVKNFSFAEAQRLAEKHRLAHGGAIRRDQQREQPVVAHAPGAPGSPGAPVLAAMSRSDLYDLAQRVRDQLRSEAAATSDGEPGSLTTSAVAAGQSTLAPALEQQLDFSSRGATYTMAMPASDLARLIETLSLREGQTTLLRMLPPPSLEDGSSSNAPSRDSRRNARNAESEAPQPTLLWLTEGPLVRQAMERLSRGNHVVLLPVIVKESSTR